MSAPAGARITRELSKGATLVIDGALLHDPYHTASLTLAFVRGSELDRECCWALALGVAALAVSGSPESSVRIERQEGSAPGIVVYFDGSFCVTGSIEAEQALNRLLALGFAMNGTGQGSTRVLELRSPPK